MAAERMPLGIDVVLEHMHRDPWPQPVGKDRTCLTGQIGHDPLPSQILLQGIHGGQRLGRGVLGMGADVQVESGTIRKIDIGRPVLLHQAVEHGHGHLPGTTGPISSGQTDPVLGLDAEDTTVIDAGGLMHQFTPRPFARTP